MSKVFISYRHDDSAFAAYAVYDRLGERIGVENIFMDIKDIPLGVDFLDVLNDTLEHCDVLLAFVGQHWLYDCALGKQLEAKRLDDPNDYVRLEIATCLKRRIPIVPVLCGDAARMPAENELPEDIRKFVHKNGLELRPGRGIFLQIDELAGNLEQMLLLKEKGRGESKKEEREETKEDVREEARGKAREETKEGLRGEAKGVETTFRPYRRAFISYASHDRAEVLKRIALLKVANIEMFFDKHSLVPGADWAGALETQIREADVLFLFWSSNAAESVWVRKEVELALSLNKEVVPIIIEMPPPRPWPELAHLHFNDRLLNLIDNK